LFVVPCYTPAEKSGMENTTLLQAGTSIVMRLRKLETRLANCVMQGVKAKLRDWGGQAGETIRLQGALFLYRSHDLVRSGTGGNGIN
jgi:hypothetical protein